MCFTTGFRGFAVCPRHTAKYSPRVAYGVPNFGHMANTFAVCLSRYTTQKSKKTV